MTDRQLSGAGKSGEAGDIEQFLARYGDTIDDRVAEVVEELLRERLAERRRARWTRKAPAVAAALAGSAVLLCWSPWTVPLVWAATAVVGMGLSRTAQVRR